MDKVKFDNYRALFGLMARTDSDRLGEQARTVFVQAFVSQEVNLLRDLAATKLEFCQDPSPFTLRCYL
jgi:hypothetical protein